MFKKHQRFLGYAYLSAAQFAIAIHIVCSKQLVFQYNISTSIIIYSRFALAALFLYAIACAKGIKIITPKLFSTAKHRKTLFMLALQGLCGGLVYNFLILHGLNYTTASAAGIVSSSLPIILAIMSYYILKEKLTNVKIVSVILASIGMLFLSYGYIEIGIVPLVGMFLILLAMVPEALYTILGKELEGKFESLHAATLVTMINALVVLPVIVYYWFLNNFDQLSLPSLGLLTISGICSALFFLLWPIGLKHVDATTAGLFTALMPIFTVLLSYLLLNEKLDLYEILGMLCILFAILIASNFFNDTFTKISKLYMPKKKHKKHK